jgi:hypothetical protein
MPEQCILLWHTCTDFYDEGSTPTELLSLLPDLILRSFDSRRLTRLSFGRQPVVTYAWFAANVTVQFFAHRHGNEAE